jgi:penicillin-binding protein 1C
MPGMVGRRAAAPILFDAFARTGEPPQKLPPAPRGAIVASTAKLPPPLRHFRPDGIALADGGPPLHIMFPPNGARLEAPIAPEGGRDPVAIKIAGGVAPVTVLANGVPLRARRGQSTVFFSPDGPGFVRLTVTDAKGAADSVQVRID